MRKNSVGIEYGLKVGSLVSVDQVGTGSIEATGDIYTKTWTDYSGTSTVVGWTTTTTKDIWYKKVGKLVFVQFQISGISNSTTTTFTLPFANNSGVQMQTLYRARDNNTWSAAGLVTVPAGGSTATLYYTTGGVTWPASGQND